MHSREEFASVLNELRNVQTLIRGLYDSESPLQKRFREAKVQAWYRYARNVKGKPIPLPIVKEGQYKGEPDLVKIESKLGDLVQACTAPVVSESRRLMEAATVRKKKLEQRLHEMADSVRVRSGTLLIELHNASLWAYSSQPSAGRYAEAEAEERADIARGRGIEVKVEPEWWEKTPSKELRGYRVLVSVKEEIDVEILRRSSGPPLREAVRMAWKRGINPRVRWWWLPHGYEEKQGLDYFGNDLRTSALATA